METLPIIFSIVLVILTVVLIVVGVQMVLVLIELRRTLRRVNEAIDTAEMKLNLMIQPLQSLGGLANGLGAGFKVFEAFVGWLNRSRSDRD